MLLPKTFTLRANTARTLTLAARLLELMPASSLANPESKDASDADMPPVRVAGGTAPLSNMQDVLLGLILALSLTSLGCGLWLWLRFRRSDAGRKQGGAVVLPSHATASASEASTPGTSASTFSLPSPPPHVYPPHRILVLGSPPDADGWTVQRRDPDDDDKEKHGGERMRRASSESEIYAVDIANGRCTWSPSVLYFAGQRLELAPLPARPVTPPPPTSWVPPPGRSKYSPRR